MQELTLDELVMLREMAINDAEQAEETATEMESDGSPADELEAQRQYVSECHALIKKLATIVTAAGGPA